ncbi:MAG: DUF4179 domain-containing protein [Elusimicrobiales bacterium]|nr:DUF4179 domain-containing protein [Elusimicrobiales bacterium]
MFLKMDGLMDTPKQNNNSVYGKVIGCAIIFAFGCLLVSALIMPAEAQNNKVKIMAYLQSDIDEDEYRKFIKDINQYYADNGISVNFTVERIKRFPPGGGCGYNAYDNDVVMHVGSGKGHYRGPPYFIAGANTDSPFAFTKLGIRAEAHELAHFLGFQDLYWFRSQSVFFSPPIDEKSLMVDVYGDDVKFCSNAKYVLKMNIARLNSGGRNSILYPAARVPKKLRVQIKGVKDKECKVYSFKRNYKKFQSLPNETPILTVNTDSSGIFEMDTFDSITDDDNEVFDLFFIECKPKRFWQKSGKFWINSLATETCYAENGAVSVCDIACVNSGEWCVFSPIPDMFKPISKPIDLQRGYSINESERKEIVDNNKPVIGFDSENSGNVGQLKGNDPVLSKEDYTPPEIKTDPEDEKQSLWDKMKAFFR